MKKIMSGVLTLIILCAICFGGAYLLPAPFVSGIIILMLMIVILLLTVIIEKNK